VQTWVEVCVVADHVVQERDGGERDGVVEVVVVVG
jgi:hypothetical protein